MFWVWIEFAVAIYNVSYFAFVFAHCLLKELSFCHKLWFSNFNIVETQCRRPLIFQTMNAVRSYTVSLNYQRFTSGYKDIGITKVEFVTWHENPNMLIFKNRHIQIWSPIFKVVKEGCLLLYGKYCLLSNEQ